MNIDDDSVAFEPEKRKPSLRERMKYARMRGEPYLTQKKKPMPGRLPPSNEVSFVIISLLLIHSYYYVTCKDHQYH